jgi:transcription-repair coupling factor (superfamily II helicase)
MFHPWDSLSTRFADALERLGGRYPARLGDLRASSLFFLVQHMLQDRERTGPILLVTETSGRAARMQQFLCSVERLVADREPNDAEYLMFPDFEPQNLFEYFDPPVELIEQRNRVLESLRPGGTQPKVIVTSYKACWRGLPAPADFFGAELILGVGAKSASPSSSDTQLMRTGEAGFAPTGDVTTFISRAELARRLEEMGYRHVSTVTSVGEYAVRGGLVDVYPLGEELPVRIDLFGDEIDELHRFAPDTQRTVDTIGQLKVLPISGQSRELALPEVQAWLRDRWHDYLRNYEPELSRSTLERLTDVVESDLALLAEGGQTPRAGWYYQAAASADATLWSYLPAGSCVLFHEEGFVESETGSYFRFWENRFADWLASGLSFLSLEDFYMRPGGDIPEVARGLAEGRLRYDAGEEEGVIDIARLHPLLTHAFDPPDGDGFPAASVGLDNPPAGRWGTAKLVETVAQFPKISRTDALVRQTEGDGRGAHPTAASIDRPLTILTQFSARLRELMLDSGVRPEIENAILPGGFVIPSGTGALARGKEPDMEAGARAVEQFDSSATGEGARATDAHWTVITDVEIFGEIADVAEAAPRRYTRDAVRRPEDIQPGDYVVHIDYGIGRFAQLTERAQGGVTKSFVEIEYAGKDRLFVPVEQLDRLRRYSYDGTAPTLNTLGREQWKKTKDKVKKDTLELAKRLLSLYKTRQVRSGHAYTQRTTWEEEFAEGFPYTMTPDQLEAWRSVEADMESDRPMDRLLVGDVGFGKTEVAMRAAFKACVDERQVLVLCPTTVLADQHFNTFTQRFRAFPFRIGVLSRFESPKEQKETVEKLRQGRLDVLIATHRGLSKDVVFPNIGLLVIDEEQRFGVKQKEALKMRFPLVDVLSMSATPIPRTLHMSLIGLRDISVIETAPTGRKSVKTYVGEYDEIMLKDAIMRELGRGGQIYYLHNRVADIERVKESLESLTGEKVLVAHGQMREERLEEVMHAFSLGAYKIMLATTIIENGLDIPAVNTIIVDHAESLGLSQMHQLRGRVGRSAAQAYAYFFHDPQRILTEDAQNRLHAIYNYAYLGAGYEIAQSDLRIRGAGNLLGAEQSGLARQVGFEYYCELLARSISDVKALSEADIEDWDELPLMEERPAAQLDVPLPSFLPDDYVDDPVLRVELLRDLARLDTDEAVDDFAAGLKDRFGPLPEPAANLLLIVRLKNAAGRADLERLTYNRVKDSFTLSFYPGAESWIKRATMRDSRLSLGQPGPLLNLDLKFEGPQTAEELVEILGELAGVKQ